MNNVDKKTSDPDIGQILFDGLNEHGFLFQEKCTDVLQNKSRQTKWQVVATEYPVDINDRSTRIDIVLLDSHDYSPNKYQIYAIVECKRVSLNRGYWLFGKPTSTVNRQTYILQLQAGYSKSGNYSIKWSKPKCDFDVRSPLVDNWWMQITRKSTKQKPDSTPKPIEDSFFQAFLGVSGIAKEIYNKQKKDPGDCYALFVPIVVTTAPLYYAGYDVDAVDITAGYIDRDKVYFGDSVEEAQTLEWIQVNYPISSSTFPETDPDISPSFVSDLRKDYRSSIFVVNSRHIEKFFSQLHLF